ncbi:MAG: ATP-binding protein [Rhodospirillaceae bacterium]
MNQNEFENGTNGHLPGELLSAALESCPVGVSICDATRPDFPFLYVNAAFTGITGFFLYELVGRSVSCLYGPETDPEILDRLKEALGANRPIDVEIVHYRKDGSSFWCELRMTPLSRNGMVSALIGVYTDITESRQRIIEDQRRQKLQALGQLAGGVAHEINNLLQPILTYSELAQATVIENFPHAAVYLDRVISSTEKARDIVRGILRFSRGDGVELIETDLSTALITAIDFVRDLLPASLIVTVEGLESGVGTARINTVELTQVFSNLLTNAAHAINGQGKVVISVRPGRVAPFQAFVLGISPGNYAMISIADNGPGMDEETIARVFEPFFTTKAPGHGTGLGLSVVYGILRNWQGAISVNSQLGSGTEFTLFIPAIA